MNSRSMARELALLVLGQIPDQKNKEFSQFSSIEELIYKALEALMQHWREVLDSCAEQLQNTHQSLLDSELQELDKKSMGLVQENLKGCLITTENILNALYETIELPRLIALSNNQDIHKKAIQRIKFVLTERSEIDCHLDNVMEGWRLKRLPRIDRDILRLAVVDLKYLHTPIPVACNEAVDLANRYSDIQGRRMINGILRRLQNNSSSNSI